MQSKYSCSQSQEDLKSYSLTYKINKDNSLSMLSWKNLKSPKYTREHNIAKPTVTEWKEIKGRSNTKASLHGLLTCSHVHHILSHVLVKGPAVFWLWHASAKIMQGGHFGALAGVHRKINPGKPQVKIRHVFSKPNNYYMYVLNSGKNNFNLATLILNFLCLLTLIIHNQWISRVKRERNLIFTWI